MTGVSKEAMMAEAFAQIESRQVRDRLIEIAEMYAFFECMASMPRQRGECVATGAMESKIPGDLRAATQCRRWEKRLNKLVMDSESGMKLACTQLTERIDRELDEDEGYTRTVRRRANVAAHLTRKYTEAVG